MSSHQSKFLPFPLAIRFLEAFLSSTLGVLIVIPILLVIYLLNSICRLVVSLLLKLFHGDEIILNPSGYDSFYMYKHPQGKRSVLYVGILESPIDLETYRKNYLERILAQPYYLKMRKILIKKFGYYALKEDISFKIESHVKLYPALEDSDRIVMEEELLGEILPKLSEDMDESKPQWEDIFIPRFKYSRKDHPDYPESGFDYSGVKTVKIFRTHHSYFDGVSNMLLISQTQSDSKGSNYPWIVDPLKDPNPSGFRQFLYYSKCFFMFPLGVVKNLWNPPSSRKSPWIPQNLSGNSLYSWSRPISNALLKDIKVANGVSMPAVLCSILASSLRNFQREFPKDSSQMSEEFMIGLIVALLPYPDLYLKNRHSMVRCYLTTREMSRLQRLRVVNEELRRECSSSQVYCNNFMPNVYGLWPAVLADICSALVSGDGVVSNFPAASKKIKFWGNEVKDLGGWICPVCPMGFGCVTLRYADYVRFCFNADKSSMNQMEMDFLLADICKETELLAKESIYGQEALKTSKKNVTEQIISSNNNNSYSIVESSTDSSRRLRNAFDNLMISVSKAKHA